MTLQEHTFPSITAQNAKRIVEEGRSQKYQQNQRKVPSLINGENAYIYNDETERRLRLIASELASTYTSLIAEKSTTPSDDVWLQCQVSSSLVWYKQLMNVPVVVQEDDGFWRYLTTCVLGAEPQISLRLKKVSSDSIVTAIDSHIGAIASNLDSDGDTVRRSGDILAKRMFLRGRLLALRTSDNPDGAATWENVASWHEFETSHVFPGTSLDGQPAWQDAILSAGVRLKKAKRVSSTATEVGRVAAKRINAARSARVAVANPASAREIAETITNRLLEDDSSS